MPRWDLAERIQEWVHPTAFNRHGKLTRAIVPGHEARQYEVILSRDGGTLSCDCRDRHTQELCLGNGHSVCYHSLAAVMTALRLQGFSCETHDSRPTGTNLGLVIEIRSAACKKSVYVTVKEGGK